MNKLWWLSVVVLVIVLMGVDLSVNGDSISGFSVVGNDEAIGTIVNETSGVAPSIYFCPVDDCENRLLEFIENSDDSLYCAFFDLRLDSVKNALFEVSKRGVDVKLFVDSQYVKDDEKEELKNMFDENIRYDYERKFSHNKFCVRDSYDVWTGSMNPTARGVGKNDNNVIVYSSKYLAQNYLDEFDELFGGKSNKKVKYPVIVLDGKRIETLFCPEDGCEKRIVEVLGGAKQDIKFMTFTFTSDPIGNQLVYKLKEGVNVSGVFEKRQRSKWAESDVLARYGADVRWDTNGYTFHHKVFIIDSKIVITGSMNPTNNANKKNDENVLIIYDESVAKRYLEEFERVFV